MVMGWSGPGIFMAQLIVAGSILIAWAQMGPRECYVNRPGLPVNADYVRPAGLRHLFARPRRHFGGGRKFTSWSAASRTTSSGSGTLWIFLNRSKSLPVGDTQNRHLMGWS